MRNSITQKSRNDDDYWFVKQGKKEKTKVLIVEGEYVCRHHFYVMIVLWSRENVVVPEKILKSFDGGFIRIRGHFVSFLIFYVRWSGQIQSTMIMKFGIWGKTKTLGFKSRDDDFIKNAYGGNVISLNALSLLQEQVFIDYWELYGLFG